MQFSSHEAISLLQEAGFHLQVRGVSLGKEGKRELPLLWCLQEHPYLGTQPPQPALKFVLSGSQKAKVTGKAAAWPPARG